MREKIIVPLIKNPSSKGRFGPTEKQDWYTGLVKAESLSRKDWPAATILLVSAFQANGEKTEMEFYRLALEININKENIVEVKKGQETIEQLQVANEYAKKKNAELIIISSILHYPRVWWICRRDGIKAKHHCTGGIPRPREVLTDITLIFLFPLIDLLGGRKWFQKKVQMRRASGKF
ncbi:MAG: ElyC/SanA/YdcF family protein [Minisyncoccia bacterium]